MLLAHLDEWNPREPPRATLRALLLAPHSQYAKTPPRFKLIENYQESAFQGTSRR